MWGDEWDHKMSKDGRIITARLVFKKKYFVAIFFFKTKDKIIQTHGISSIEGEALIFAEC